MPPSPARKKNIPVTIAAWSPKKAPNIYPKAPQNKLKNIIIITANGFINIATINAKNVPPNQYQDEK